MPEARRVRGLRGKGGARAEERVFRPAQNIPLGANPLVSTKIALTAPQTIPLDKLIIHDGNVRQIEAGVSIENLAADIARRGLLQSLSARPILNEAGEETGFYGVQAGGRRLRALQLLVKQKKLAKNAPVPCIVRTEGFVEADCRLLGRQPQGSADRLQAGLDPRRQSGAVQAQRPHARNPANRRRRLPRLRRHRQSRRQGIPVLDHREGGA